ncbi:MAG: LON peptidase substrate-binding domain-containing protein [Alphaproteobacteria bacterium]|nr:LON peptidase substrate-binding domain-containing protein [Alphaproteobacteria bacterium]
MTQAVRSAPSLESLPRTIPVFPLPTLLLPRGRLPLNIFEPRYLAMIEDALKSARVIGMVQPISPDMKVPPLYPIGCLGRLTSWSETGDGRFLITLTGLIRFRIDAELKTTTPYRQVEASYDAFAGDLSEPPDEGVDRERLGELIKMYFKQSKADEDWESVDQVSSEVLVNWLSMICPFEVAEKQALLEAPALADRARLLTVLIEMAAAGGAEKGTLQ